MSQKSTSTEKSYILSGVSTTEEMLLNTSWPSEEEPAKGWRQFRIEYLNADGHSNIEGTILFPPGIDPYPLLDKIEEYLTPVEPDHPETCRCEVCRFWS